MIDLPTLGRNELIDIVELKLKDVPAKVDTGADSSAIWASVIREHPDSLECVFFGPGSPYYTGKTVTITEDYTVIKVVSSFGHKERRYKIKLNVRLKGRHIRASFTLSDRSARTYPILLGRRLLHKKFVVDVSRRSETKTSKKAA